MFCESRVSTKIYVKQQYYNLETICERARHTFENAVPLTRKLFVKVSVSQHFQLPVTFSQNAFVVGLCGSPAHHLTLYRHSLRNEQDANAKAGTAKGHFVLSKHEL